jgi:anti-anti-sigma factor
VVGEGVEATLEVAVTRLRDAGFVLRFAGDLDLATAPQVAQLLDGLAASRLPVRLDLADVGFVDVAGLQMLLSACVTTPGGADVQVIASCDALRRLLELALEVATDGPQAG